MVYDGVDLGPSNQDIPSASLLHMIEHFEKTNHLHPMRSLKLTDRLRDCADAIDEKADSSVTNFSLHISSHMKRAFIWQNKQM